MITNQIELPKPLDEAGREKAKAEFNEAFEGAPLTRAGVGHCWTVTGVGNHVVYVEPDYSDGSLLVGVDLGVPVTEENMVELWALARFYEAFRIECGGLATAPAGETVRDGGSWNAGDSLHFYLNCRIGAWAMPAVLQMPIQAASGLRGSLLRVAGGKASAFEEIADGDASSRLRRLDILRHLSDAFQWPPA